MGGDTDNRKSGDFEIAQERLKGEICTALEEGGGEGVKRRGGEIL